MSPIAPGSGAFARYLGAFPATIPEDTYFVGWIIDSSGDSTFGEVGEWAEDNNVGAITGYQLVVTEPPLFADGFESGNTSAWAQ